jgi:hypothetical protein
MHAYTTNLNTPETDAQDRVMHTVEWTEDGWPMKQDIMASDPLEAIRLIQRQQAISKGFL